MKSYDVVSLCNALVDILVKVDQETLEKLGLNKGIMHLVDKDRQKEVLSTLPKQEFVTELGGSALNAIRTLASLGQSTAFAGMVGEDEFGSLITQRMDELGIKAQLGIAQEPTGSCLILVTPDGERTMNTHLGASRLYTQKEVPTQLLQDSQVFHFCGYQWDTDGQIVAIQKAIEVAKEAGTKISFDVADPFVVDRHRDVFLDLIAEDADIVFANKEEARMLMDVPPEQAAYKIAETGATAVIKCGAEGALICKGGDLKRVAPKPTNVEDTTAAGDMFAAGFLYGYTKGQGLQVCGEIAALMASDVISRVGATISGSALGEARQLLN